LHAVWTLCANGFCVFFCYSLSDAAVLPFLSLLCLCFCWVPLLRSSLIGSIFWRCGARFSYRVAAFARVYFSISWSPPCIFPFPDSFPSRSYTLVLCLCDRRSALILGSHGRLIRPGQRQPQSPSPASAATLSLPFVILSFSACRCCRRVALLLRADSLRSRAAPSSARRWHPLGVPGSFTTVPSFLQRSFQIPGFLLYTTLVVS